MKKIILIFSLIIIFISCPSTAFANEESEVTTQVNVNTNETGIKNDTEPQIATQDEDIYYNVTFVGYKETLVKKVKAGETVVPPTYDLPVKYYWVERENPENEFNFSTPITKDLILDIVLETKKSPIPYYDIEYKTNGGTINGQTIPTQVGDILSGMPTSTREGYSFLGWFDKNGKLWKNGMKISGSMTLYAKWEKNQVVKVNSEVSPKTADDNNVLMYGLVLLVSIVTFIGVKRKNVG
jgi:uncharacterized repeat protein (TIGR02543 family)